MEFRVLNYMERKNLTSEELKQYFLDLRNYYLTQEFDEKKFKENEEYCLNFYKKVKPFFNRFYKPIIIGENNVPKENGLIFVSNHTHAFDPLLALINLERKPMHLLAKKEVLDIKKGPINVGPLYEKIGSVFVDRNDDNSKIQSKEELIKIVLHNGSVIIYPEGTINKTSKMVLEFQKGAVAIAQITGRPIIPVTVTNDYKYSGRPIVIYDKEIYVKEEDDVAEVTKKLEDIISTNIWQTMEINAKRKVRK